MREFSLLNLGPFSQKLCLVNSPWRYFYGGVTMGYTAVGYKPAKAVLK